jgi:hypothetical protein
MARTLGSAWVNISPSGFKEFYSKAQVGINKALKGVDATVPVDADTKPATLSIDDLKTKLADFSRKVYQARLGADDKELDAKLAAISVKLGALGRRVESPRITLEGAAAVEAQLLALDVSFDKLKNKAEDVGGSATGLGRDLGALSNIAFPALIGAGIAVSPVIATLSVGMGGLGLAAASVVGPILKAGTATKEQQKALASLDPAQRAAYDSLGALKDQFSGFATSLEPDVLDLFNRGLHLATGLLGDIQPVAAATGKALGGMLDAIDTEFRSGTWQQFFGFMATQAGPDVKLVTDALIPLLDTLPKLLETLQPIAVQFLQAASGAAQLADAAVTLNQKIDQLGSHADHSSGLLGKLADAGKKAVDQMLPGIPAAQKLAQWLGSLGDNSAPAAKHTADLSKNTADLTSNIKLALPPTAQVAANLAVQAANAATAHSNVSLLNQAWQTFLGMSSGLENAQLAVESGLSGIASAAKTSGATFTGTNQASQNLQSSFESGLLPSVQDVIGGMRQAHAKAGDLATVIATDLKPAVDDGALSNKGFKQQLFDLAQQAGYTGPNKLKPLKDWFDKNASSTQNAKDKVDKYVGALATVPTKKQTILELIASGKGGVKVTSNQVGVAAKLIALQKQGFAGGGFVNFGSGPTADDVPAMLSRGELVVPANMVAAGAVDHLRGKLPGFAGGGLINAVSAFPGQVNSAVNADTSAALAADTNAAIAAMTAAIRAAQQAQAARNAGVGLGIMASPARTGSVAVEQAFARSILWAYGWGTNQMSPLIALWNQESGWNPYAVNPSSGAYGIPQALGHGHPYNLGDYQAQIRWGLSYIKSRYGSPAGAWAHEVAFNWYKHGGLVPGYASGGSVAQQGQTYLNAWRNRRGGGFGAAWGPVVVNEQIAEMAAAIGRAKTLSKASGLSAGQHRFWANAAADETKRLGVLNKELGIERSWRGQLTNTDTTLARDIAAAGATPSLAKNVRSWRAQIAAHKYTIGQISGMLGYSNAYLAAHPPAPKLPGVTHTFGGDIGDTISAYLASNLSPLGLANGGRVKSYDSGGYLAPGLNLAYNGTGRPEPVGGPTQVDVRIELGDSFKRVGLTPAQAQDIKAYVRVNGGNVQKSFGVH